MQARFILFLALLVCLGACGKKRPDTTNVSGDDAEMNAAIKEAQKNFETFRGAFQKGELGEGLVKVYFTDPGKTENGEHMWVQPQDLSSVPMKGVLLGQPAWLVSVKEGQTVTFTDKDVTDWLMIRDGKAAGAYTVQVLRKRMSSKERAEHDAGYPFKFE
jgi:uncharacterized protein YegJ (DUF2314 family)